MQWSTLFRGPNFRDDQDVAWGEACDPKKAGIYRLVAVDDAGQPAAISRLLGADTGGTLYVGCAPTNLCGRLGKVERTLKNGRNCGHGAAARLVCEAAIARRFPLRNIALTWLYDNDAGKAEENFLRAYLDEFGETPPLNEQ